MKYNKAFVPILLASLLSGCGGGGGGNNNPPSPTPAPAGSNELTVTVNGSLADPNTSAGYFNKAAVAVTICQPNTSNCQTITDILLDTGSYGLRIFSSAISVPLTQTTISSKPVGECVGFADGSTSWGPVMIADVVLAGEPAVQVPIQVLNNSFGNSSVCGTPDASPQSAGFHGILGIGMFAQDCGEACANSAANGMYFTCSGGSCSGTAVPLGSQVQNPVAALPQDNNGVLVQFPSVPAGGAASVDGKVIFGIATRSNNAPSGVTTFDVSISGQFPTFFTTLNGTDYKSFLDTGSNAYFIPHSANLLPLCSVAPWFCPAQTTTFNITNKSATGAVSAPTQIEIANAESLFNSGNNVFSNLGGETAGGEIDLGLPFFFGRNVFVGYEGQTSPLGTGPYWAF